MRVKVSMKQLNRSPRDTQICICSAGGWLRRGSFSQGWPVQPRLAARNYSTGSLGQGAGCGGERTGTGPLLESVIGSRRRGGFPGVDIASCAWSTVPYTCRRNISPGTRCDRKYYIKRSCAHAVPAGGP
jgi:hypothetical protein